MSEGLVNITDMEMILVKCGNDTNFEATLPIFPSVQEKVDHWTKVYAKNQTDEPKPISFLILGFDSTSRSHVYRSLPKTLQVMDRLGFVDFEGLHSIKAQTLPNFLALL